MMQQHRRFLQTLFNALSLLVSHFVDDHLPGGIYDNPSI